MHKNNDQAGQQEPTSLLAEALAVFDLMLVGCSLQCFGDYQNGDGETIGPRMDALHAALREAAPAHALTDAEIEEMWDAQWSYHGHEPCKLGHVEFARAIAAHLARKG